MTKNSSNPVKCGKCLSCRINQRSEKTHRIMLEAMAHEHNCFVTLTYNDEHLPPLGNVSKDELDKWIKRFRKAYKQKIRVFGVGEYGEESYRPHYHLILFGVPATQETLDLITKTWTDPETKKSKGHVMVGTCTDDSIQYCAGYIVKKLTGRNDWILSQLAPEFTTQSRMPGLGFATLQKLASILNCRIDDIIASFGDVPHFLQYGSKQRPLDRYSKNYLRKFLDVEKPIFEETTYYKEMQALQKNTHDDFPNASKIYIGSLMSDTQKVLNRETQFKLHQKRRKL